jgi:ribonuclease Z
MFDCGEGTQRQMFAAKVGLNKKMKLFISHMHGDHVLGIPGLLQTMSLLGRTERLKIFGPKGIRDFIDSFNRTVPYNLAFELETNEVKDGLVTREPEYDVYSAWGKHVIPCLSYAIVEKPRPGRFNAKMARRLGVPEGPLWKRLQMGQTVTVKGKTVNPKRIVGPPRQGSKIAYVSDTRPCKAIERLIKGSDLLVSESTFDNSKKDKASEYGHSTAGEAANLACKARVKRLALTHVSASYDDPTILLKQAKKVFRHTVLANDLLRLEVEPLEK